MLPIRNHVLENILSIHLAKKLPKEIKFEENQPTFLGNSKKFLIQKCYYKVEFLEYKEETLSNKVLHYNFIVLIQ